MDRRDRGSRRPRFRRYRVAVAPSPTLPRSLRSQEREQVARVVNIARNVSRERVARSRVTISSCLEELSEAQRLEGRGNRSYTRCLRPRAFKVRPAGAPRQRARTTRFHPCPGRKARRSSSRSESMISEQTRRARSFARNHEPRAFSAARSNVPPRRVPVFGAGFAGMGKPGFHFSLRAFRQRGPR